MIFKKPISDSSPWQESDLVGEELDKKGMQTYINELLGIDAKTFVNSILFGQRMKRLVESDNDEKRELLEKLFELSFIADAKEKAKTKFNKVTNLINECNTVDASLSRSIADKNKTIEEYEEVLATFETNKKQKIADEEKELTSLEAELATLNKNMATAKEELEKLPKNENLDRSDYNTAKKELEDINNRLGELKKEKFEHESEIANSVKNIAKLTTELGNVNDTCYACKQPLKEEDVENVKSKLRDDIKKEEDAKSVLEFAVPKIDKNLETVTKSQKEKEEEVEKLWQHDVFWPWRA